MPAHVLQKGCSRLLFSPTRWPAYLPDMSPIQHAWDLAGRRLTREPRPATSKRRTFAAHTSNMEFSSTIEHSKSI
ncbi:hypothetical protein TNCV_4915991 [Trichonephila clavipes]|nr:hypothetical protein TNCV_4915991 [Trichonephila clavipes]